MLYVSLGIPSSASTWVYNILKAILKARGIGYDAYLCETLGDLNKHGGAKARAQVWKAHNMEAPLLRMIGLADVPLVVSVRDPRDAVASLVGRFNANPIDSAQQVARSIASVFSAVGESAKALVFEYEAGFPERVETVREIADLMGVSLTPAELDDIRATFSIESVRAFTSKLDALPEGQLVRNGEDVMDADTHFHRSHVSDGAVDKWRGIIPADLHDDVNALFDQTIGMAFYEPGMRMTFPSRLFHGGSHSESKPRSQYRRGGFCLLEHVYLGRGNWRIEIGCRATGGFRGARALQVFQSPGPHSEYPVDQSAETMSVAFDYNSRRNDAPIEVCLLYDGQPAFSADAVPEATLRATYRGPL